MKTFLLTATLMLSASLAQATCVAYDPIYQPVCAPIPVKEACEARISVCKWAPMNILGSVNTEELKKFE